MNDDVEIVVEVDHNALAEAAHPANDFADDVGNGWVEGFEEGR